MYQEYLGRPGDIGGLTSYAQSFGPEIDLAERQAFIEGAVGAGELSRARADELLAGLTAGTTTDVVEKIMLWNVDNNHSENLKDMRIGIQGFQGRSLDQ